MAAEFTPALAREREPGTITTFYSYKGGTGRTMALANTACVLAERLAPDEKVLVVDWDLEAPGLHRYFPPRLRANDPSQDMGLDAGPGLIDLFIALSEQLPDEPARDRAQADAAVERAVAALDWQAYIGQTEHAAIHILRAGRNDDGGYGRRVNTFGWEQLFQRAPGIYRAFAERLARDYRWVLIDSRTGVTDISGICTSLLPEKLVVVFTPNRQSLTGVRELVQTATAYRRGHDDLRPLLVLPLPSRIEASMEKLRTHWRYGRPEDGITGYQPMFQNLLAECYDLAACDLGAYFDAVQIQQTPDCAYGEVISIRSHASSDRFSLASSYRVFVDRLTAATPPWEPLDAEPFASFASPPLLGSGTPLPSSTPASDRPLIPVDFDPFAASGALEAADPFDDPFSLPAVKPDAATAGTAAAPRSVPPQPSRQRVFLSHASEDRARVDPVASLLRADGFDVFNPRDVQAGKRWDDQIAEALDQSDVVVVFWSQSAFASEAVRVEAEEGQRRGVMLPVLLDDARPPISFRGVQAADLRRDYQGQLPVLLKAIARIAGAAPGERTMLAPAGSFRPELYLPTAETPSLSPPVLPPAAPYAGLAAPQSPTWPPSVPPPVSASASAPPPASVPAPGRSRRGTWALAVAGAVAALAVVMWWPLRLAGDSRPPLIAANPPASAAVPAPYRVSVPDLLNRDTGVAAEIASSLKLRLVATDEQGQSFDALPAGLVLSQSPEAGARVDEGTTVQLTVATRTATVPSVAGMSLGDALARLRTVGLGFGEIETVVGSGAKVGTVVRQAPQAGTTVPQGSKVGVGVAGEARPARAPSKLQASPEGAAAAGKAADAAKK